MSGRSRRKKCATKDTQASEFRNCMWSTIRIKFTHPEVYTNKNLAGARLWGKTEVATADDCEVSFTYTSICIQHKLIIIHMLVGTAVEQWLRCCATNRKVAGSIPAGVTGIFHWHKILQIALWPWGRLSLEQKWVPVAFPGGKGGRCVRLTTLPPPCAVVMKSGNLNFLEPSGPPQACNRTALPFTFTYACTLVHVSAKHVDWYKLMNDFLLHAYVGVCELLLTKCTEWKLVNVCAVFLQSNP